MRYCRQCGRARNAEFHDQVPQTVAINGVKSKMPPAHPTPAGWYEGHPVFPDGADATPRMRYTCRVTLVATSPVSGKHFPVHHPQSIKELPVAWVHDDRLELDA